MERSTVCAGTQIAGTTAVAVSTIGPGPHVTKVTVSWSSSLDQDAGEKDVGRYMVFKKSTASPDWGSPIADLAASQTTYSLDDTTLPLGSWVYGIVAQDCSPNNSSFTPTNVVKSF